MTKPSVLIVVAHPDDEILGCGATAALLAESGHTVHTCILSGGAAARRQRPNDDTLREHATAAITMLGMAPPTFGEFPNIAMNTVPHLHVVQFIEQAIEATHATVIFTHHPGDLNNDHLATSRACQAAARLFQRKPGISPLRSLYYMEILSSTDWAFRNTDTFIPDTFINVEPNHITRKIEALSTYAGVMRPFPHSRSEEAIRALAMLRGAQSGTGVAEAFQTAFRRGTPGTI